MLELADLFSRDIGALVVQGPVVDWFLGLFGDSVVGFSLPKIILLHTDAPSWAVWHEVVHQHQMERLRMLYWPIYLYQYLRYGYTNMPLEIEAHQF